MNFPAHNAGPLSSDLTEQESGKVTVRPCRSKRPIGPSTRGDAEPRELRHRPSGTLEGLGLGDDLSIDNTARHDSQFHDRRRLN